MTLAKVLALGGELGVQLTPDSLMPAGFFAWTAAEDDSSLVRLAVVPVKEFTRMERGRQEVVRAHQETRMGEPSWPHPPEVGGHRVQAVYTHPASKSAIYDLGNGLHAEGTPGRGGAATFKPGPVLRSNTGLQPGPLAQKGWTKATPPKPEPAAQVMAQKGVKAAGAAGKDAWAKDRQDWKPGQAKPGAAKSALGKVKSAKPALPWTQKPGGVIAYKDSMGIDRSKMPQLSGMLPSGEYGSARDLIPKFMEELKSRGVPVSSSRVPPWTLKPTQTTGDKNVVRIFADKLKSGEIQDTKPIMVSSDHRILDGHHTWAGRMQADAEGGRPGLPPDMPVVKIGLPAKEALAEIQRYQDKLGIKSRATGEGANPEIQAALAKLKGAAPAAGKSALGKVTGKQPVQPLTDDQYREYAAKLEDAMEKAIAAGQETHKTETLDGGNLWKPERAAQHQAIIHDLMQKYQDVPSEGRAIITGGLMGAGKSTTLKNNYPEVAAGKFATVNPDEIKEEMAKRGMIPDLPGMPGAAPMERSVLAHEESAHIAKQLAYHLQKTKKNLLWDISMSSPGSVQSRIDSLHGSGYSHVHGMYVNIPLEASAQSAEGRHRNGLEAFRRGEGPGERQVSARLVRSAARPKGSNNTRDAFEAMKPQFDSWKQWDRAEGPDGKLGDSKLAAQGGKDF